MACETQNRCYLSDPSWIAPFAETFLDFYRPCTTNLSAASPASEDTTKQTQLQATTCIPQMPPEILRLVQQHLLNNSRHEFLSALQVSRTWFSLGRSLLWRDVILTQQNLESFAEAIKQSPEAATYTRSLTVISSRHDYLYQRSDRARQWLPLIEILGSVPNLRTFSLFLKNSDDRKLITVSRKHLNQILEALPPTLTSLELDMTCAMTRVAVNGYHPCLTIRNMLPRLKHLRLCRGMWCHHLFEGLSQPCPDLKTVLFDDSRRGYQDVCERVDPAVWRSDLIGERVAFASREAIDGGLMPALESFNVLTPVSHRGPPSTSPLEMGPMGLSGSSRIDSFSSLQRKDVLNSSTTSCPIAFVSRGTWLLRCPSATAADGVGEIIGHYDELSPLVEFEVQRWSGSTNGSRLPDAYPKRLRSKAYPFLLRDLLPDPATNEDARALMTLQHWEKECGRKLLYPKTHEGLQRGAIHFRDICEEEAPPSVNSTCASRANSAC